MLQKQKSSPRVLDFIKVLEFIGLVLRVSESRSTRDETLTKELYKVQKRKAAAICTFRSARFVTKWNFGRLKVVATSAINSSPPMTFVIISSRPNSSINICDTNCEAFQEHLLASTV